MSLFDEYDTLDERSRKISTKCVWGSVITLGALAGAGIAITALVLFLVHPSWSPVGDLTAQKARIDAFYATDLPAVQSMINSVNSTVGTLLPSARVNGTVYRDVFGNQQFNGGNGSNIWSVIDQNNQSQFKVSNTPLNVTGGSLVATFNNVLDDGTGKAVFAGSVTLNGFLYRTTESGKTATGTTAADAYNITKGITQFSTTATGTGAVLPIPASAGLIIRIINRGANTLAVYAPTTPAQTINGAASVTIATNTAAEYTYFGGNTWFA